MKLNNDTLYEQVKKDLSKSGEITQVHIYKAAASSEARLLKRLETVADKTDIEKSTKEVKEHIDKTSARTDDKIDGMGNRILSAMKNLTTDTWSVLQLIIVILMTVVGFFIGHMVFGYMVDNEVRPFAKVTSSVTKAVADNAGNIKYYKDFVTYAADPVMRILTIGFFMAAGFLLTLVIIDLVKHIKVRRAERKEE